MLHSSGQASNAMKEVDNSLSKWLHFPQVIICPLKSWWRKWTMQLWCFGELLVVTFSKKKTWDYNFWEKVRETLKTFKIYKTFVLWTITLRFPANNSRRFVRTKNFSLRLQRSIPEEKLRKIRIYEVICWIELPATTFGRILKTAFHFFLHGIDLKVQFAKHAAEAGGNGESQRRKFS